ncbi:hypothetical protein HK104_004692 [Borealophlyctis nickersoniae]|nr:hypothetical protein HK104_004692 [Borealophlyctis nickersoniae]
MRFTAFVALLSAAVPLAQAAPAPQARAAGTNAFDRFFVIVLENTNYSGAMADPYLGTTLKNKGRLLSNYWALTHPSEPNYIAMIAGSYYGITDDGVHNLSGPIVTDLLDRAGISWKTYQENYPGNCYTGAVSSTYYRKHNPFISFTSISGNAAKCAKIVPATQLTTDMNNKSVPQYVFYTPDINNDGHDTGVAFASKWLKGFLEPKLTDPQFSRTAFFITFDESAGSGSGHENQVYGLLVGGAINARGLAGTTDGTKYTHYSQISTVEANWGLGKLSPTEGDTGAAAFAL